MKLLAWLLRRLRPAAASAPPRVAPAATSPASPRAAFRRALEQSRQPRDTGVDALNPWLRGSTAAALAGDAKLDPFTLPTYPPGVLPNGQTKLAQDDGSVQYVMSSFGYANSYHGLWAEGVGFMGYPYLAELLQRPEYRRPCEVMGEEMTRKWMYVTAAATDDDLTDKIKEIEQRLEDLNVRELFHDLIALAEGMGRAQLAINVGTNDDDQEMRTPLVMRASKVGKGRLKGFKVIDPMWTAPNDYNALDPLSPAFYRPQTWFLMGRLIHASRLMTLIPHPVPQILLPAYNFGGLALTQMMKPYVDNWLRTRQSISDEVQAFTVFVLETNMQAFLQGGDAVTPQERAELFANLKANLGLMLIDKGQEGFQNVSAPLGGLDKLQAQAQEHMAAVACQPLVKMTGITPSGLNATSDGEIRVFYDTINARQQRLFSPILKTVLNLVQLDLYGEVDPAISHSWEPLYQLDEAGRAAVRKTNADTDAVLMQNYVITPDESRARLAADKESPYAGLEGEAPEPPEPAVPPSGASTTDPSERIDNAGEEGSTSGANSGDSAADEFRESDHPRGQPGNAGEFSAGGGGGGAAKTAAPAKKAKAPLVATVTTGKTRTLASGLPLPPHIAKLKLPPA